MTMPASVRHRNPGAMGLGKSAKKFGATKSTTLNDGAKNTIATFPTSVDGAGALFHLLHTAYAGMSIWAAMHKWGDGKTLEAKGQALEARGKVMEGRLQQANARARTDGYVSSLAAHSRFTGDDTLTKALLEDADSAIEFGKAMARHEAGMEYPMTDAQWAEAHQEFMTVLSGGHILLDRKQPTVNLKPLDLARAALGEKEVPGKDDHNTFIVDCFRDVGSAVRDDETAWCAAFAGAMLMRSGCAFLRGVLEARKYLEYGHAIDEPEEGCVVVFWRVKPNGWQGHVAFVESFTATHLTIIGGNQSNAVTRLTVPRTGSKSQVLGYRRPVSNVVAAKEIIQDTSMQQKGVGALGALGALLWSIKAAIGTAMAVVGEMIGLLPDTAAQVGTTVGAGQQLTEAAGMPWPIQLGLFITVCALAFGAYNSWKRLRPNNGAVTKPAYETDETPEDLGQPDAFAPPIQIVHVAGGVSSFDIEPEWVDVPPARKRAVPKKLPPKRKPAPRRKASKRKAAA